MSLAARSAGHGSIALPWLTLALAAMAILLYLLCGPSPADWVFDRAAIAEGEWWRLITAHWVHSDSAHAGWDIGALLLFGAVFEKRLQWRLPLGLLLASVAVAAWIWWGLPDLRYYCGLSGILNGLLVMGLASLWRDLRHPLILATGLVAVIKIALEVHLGQALLTQTAWMSVPSAHAAGFASGLLLASAILYE